MQHTCAPHHTCARGGPLCNGLVHHCLCKRARLCTAACARGVPMCNSLAQHSCTTPRATLLHTTPCATRLCTTSFARGHACAQLLVQQTGAPSLVQEESPCATALHTTPCTTLGHHPSCKRSPTCKCLAHHPSCTTSGRRARSTAVRGRRATPSCNAAPQWLERRWRGGGVCRKSQPNSLRIH